MRSSFVARLPTGVPGAQVIVRHEEGRETTANMLGNILETGGQYKVAMYHVRPASTTQTAAK